MTNQEYAAALRMLADFYAAHPEAPQPYESDRLDFNLACEGRAGLEAVVRAFGGRWTKHEANNLYYVFGHFGPFRLKVYLNRAEVCDRVQIGTVRVPAVPERVIPASPEHEAPVYEWRCGSVLESATAKGDTP